MIFFRGQRSSILSITYRDSCFSIEPLNQKDYLAIGCHLSPLRDVYQCRVGNMIFIGLIFLPVFQPQTIVRASENVWRPQFLMCDLDDVDNYNLGLLSPI